MKLTFDEHLQKIFGPELDKYLHHAPVGEFIRVNTLRANADDVIRELSRRGFELERVSDLDDALRILSMPYDPTQSLFHFAGWFVKQSLSSQLPVRAPGRTSSICAPPPAQRPAKSPQPCATRAASMQTTLRASA